MNKKYLIIGGIVLGVLILGGILFLVLGGKKTPTAPSNGPQTNGGGNIDTNKETNLSKSPYTFTSDGTEKRFKVQITKADKFILKRKKLAGMYDDVFKDIPWVKLIRNNGLGSSAYHIYVLRFDFKRIKKSRFQVMNYLRKRGIGTQVHYIPVYLQPYYAELGYRPGACPNAEAFYESEISIPIFPGLSRVDQTHVIKTLRVIFS